MGIVYKNMLYYTPPPDDLFKEVKAKCIEIWKTYDDEFRYATSKVNRIKDLENVSDNFMHMVAMFDLNNQMRLKDRLSSEACTHIRLRMIDGGAERELIVF